VYNVLIFTADNVDMHLFEEISSFVQSFEIMC